MTGIGTPISHKRMPFFMMSLRLICTVRADFTPAADWLFGAVLMPTTMLPPPQRGQSSYLAPVPGSVVFGALPSSIRPSLRRSRPSQAYDEGSIPFTRSNLKRGNPCIFETIRAVESRQGKREVTSGELTLLG